MKIRILLVLFFLLVELSNLTTYSQVKEYTDNYNLLTSFNGVNIYARWSLTCSWCSEGVDLKIVNNNNEKIKIDYDVTWSVGANTILTRPQELILEAGQTIQPDNIGSPMRWDKPSGYSARGDVNTRITFGVHNIKVNVIESTLQNTTTTWHFDGAIDGLQIYSMKTNGFGYDVIRWKVQNINPYQVDFKFKKVYTTSKGEVKTGTGEIWPKPGEILSGNVFAGDADLCDNPFDPGIKITKWQMIKISVDNMNEKQNNQLSMGKSNNSTTKSEEVQKKKQEELRQKQEAENERRRKEEERKREELQARADAQTNREAESKEQQKKLQDNIQQFANLTSKSNTSRFEGDTWRMMLGFGMSYLDIPIMENMSGSSINSYSRGTTGGGLGGEFVLELWPYYGNNYSLSVYGTYDIGGASLSSISENGYSYVYGVRSTVGIPAFHLVAEYGQGERSASISNDEAVNGFDAAGGGQGSYSFSRYGLGLRWNFGRPYLLAYAELMALKESPNIENSSQYNVYRATIDYGLFFLKIEYSPNYPYPGIALYKKDNNSIDYIEFSACYYFSILGEPY